MLTIYLILKFSVKHFSILALSLLILLLLLLLLKLFPLLLEVLFIYSFKYSLILLPLFFLMFCVL